MAHLNTLRNVRNALKKNKIINIAKLTSTASGSIKARDDCLKFLEELGEIEIREEYYRLPNKGKGLKRVVYWIGR